VSVFEAIFPEYPIWYEVRTHLASIEPVEKTALNIAFSKFKKEEEK
jgi:hypothetical protein